MIHGIGRQFYGSWRGTVQSRFEHAVNIQVSGRSPACLVTLLSSANNMGERCLALAEDDASSLFVRLQPGMDVRCDEREVSFPGSDVPPISLRDAAHRLWSTPPPPPQTATDVQAMLAVLPMAFEALARCEGQLAASPLRAAAVASFDAIFARVRESEEPGISSLRRIVGAGPGLTPTGDDLLVGLCCALHGAQHPLYRFLQHAVPPLFSRTTLVSQTMLHDALHGVFNRPLATLRDALMTQASETNVRHALHRAMQFGASSGADGARGLLCGLHLVQNYRHHVSPEPVSGKSGHQHTFV